MLETPALALGLATRETLRMADITSEMMQSSIQSFQETSEEAIVNLQQKDDSLDILDREIKLYLTKLSQKGLIQEQPRRVIAMLSVVNNLENIGDILDKNLLELAKKKARKQLIFSEQGWTELQELYHQVKKNLEQTIAAFAATDLQLARQIIDKKAQINELEKDLRQSHIARLQAGLPESLETSEIHLDVLTNLKRINSHISAIAYAILEQFE